MASKTLAEVCLEIANSLRTKLPSTSKFKPIDFASNILTIGSNATATSTDVVAGKTAYVGNDYITGSFTGIDLAVSLSSTETVYTPPSGQYYKKVTVPPSVAKEKYDGTVIITAPSLSGTYVIDSEKLYNLLLETRDNVAQSLNFSAGVKGSDAGLIYYTSMTFDFGTKALQYSGDSGTNSFSNYNYTTYGDGWKEYPDGDNGATINIDEEQVVSGNFYVLFTSIATKEG